MKKNIEYQIVEGKGKRKYRLVEYNRITKKREVIGEFEYAYYANLLAKALDIGLREEN